MTYPKRFLIVAGIGLAGLAAAATAFAVTHSGKPGRYAAFDLDGDSAVTLTEIREIGQRRFEVLDIDGNGAISGAELPLMLQASDPRRGRPDGRAALASDQGDNDVDGAADAGLTRPLSMDFNSDGAIQGGEFIAGFAAPFALGDIDGDGILSDAEMRSGAFNRGDRRGGRH